MKKIVMLLIGIIGITLYTNDSYARLRWDNDFSILYGTPPISGLKPSFGIAGFSGGLGPDLANWDSMILNLRFDISMFFWKPNDEYSYGSGSYRYNLGRFVITVGPKFYFPLGKVVLPYIEGGGEFSYDFTLDKNNDGAHFGGYAGGGINFRFRHGFLIGVGARYHFIKNSYLTVGPTIGTRW